MTPITPAQLDEWQRACDEARPIPGFDGYYACADGSIWSVRNWRGWGIRRLTPYPEQGYLRVRLHAGGARIRRPVHQLVCLAFSGERPSRDHEVRHLNGNRLDNRAENLRWGTRKENAADRDAHGTTARGPRNGGYNATTAEMRARGERNGKSRLTEGNVRFIRRMRRDGFDCTQIAAMFKVHRSTVSRICAAAMWAHVEAG